MDVVRALSAMGGAARREDLLARGVRARAIAAARNEGAVLRPYRGTYALPDASRLAVMAAMFRAAPTCVTLLRDWKIPTIDADQRLHLAVPVNRGLSPVDRRPRAAVALHRTDASLTGEPVIDALEALAQAHRCLDEYAFVAAVDAALNRRLLTSNELPDLARRAHIALAWLEARTNGLAESPGETYARLALVDAGFRVRLQVSFAPDLRVDIIVEGALTVEINGRRYHSDAHTFQRDHTRMRRLLGLNYPVVPFTVAEVLRNPRIVPREVGALLDARGLGPTTS